ncbi:hypothetical protein [Streptomyces sp. NPDC052225]|uniref:hypothetical protein n=1 Tax=Streptomyces sp. NPDC052225 TaxID=3154949 RepID=UPI0034330E67
MTYALPVLQRLRPSGSIWAALRLHRLALWVWTAAVLVSVALLLWLYGPGADAATSHLGACRTAGCEPVGGAYGRYELLTQLTGAVILCAPYIAAVFMGGSCVGRELERGTAQLAWTQSRTPTRWLATTLAVPAAWFLIGLVPLVALHHLVWASGPLPHAYPWYDPDIFAGGGAVPFARVLLGLAAGALGGLLCRKALPGALLGALAPLVADMLGRRYRPSLWPTVTDTGLSALRPPAGAQVLIHGAVPRSTGERIANNNACVGADSPVDLHRCTEKFQDFWVTYHPKSHYWPLQLAESATVITMAALLTAVAFRLLRRRTA